MNEQADVIKKHTCPACGIESVMRFRLRDPILVAACSRCGAEVQWRQEPADGKYPQSAFDDRPEWSHAGRREEVLADSDSYYYG
jgi:transcription elongation factor Elf1